MKVVLPAPEGPMIAATLLGRNSPVTPWGNTGDPSWSHGNIVDLATSRFGVLWWCWPIPDWVYIEVLKILCGSAWASRWFLIVGIFSLRFKKFSEHWPVMIFVKRASRSRLYCAARLYMCTHLFNICFHHNVLNIACVNLHTHRFWSKTCKRLILQTPGGNMNWKW